MTQEFCFHFVKKEAFLYTNSIELHSRGQMNCTAFSTNQQSIWKTRDVTGRVFIAKRHLLTSKRCTSFDYEKRLFDLWFMWSVIYLKLNTKEIWLLIVEKNTFPQPFSICVAHNNRSSEICVESFRHIEQQKLGLYIVTSSREQLRQEVAAQSSLQAAQHALSGLGTSSFSQYCTGATHLTPLQSTSGHLRQHSPSGVTGGLPFAQTSPRTPHLTYLHLSGVSVHTGQHWFGGVNGGWPLEQSFGCAVQLANAQKSGLSRHTGQHSFRGVTGAFPFGHCFGGASHITDSQAIVGGHE